MSLYGPMAMMELYIETLTGVLMELMVHPFETVYNVKAKINKLEGFPISEQHLIWQAVELDNEMSLHHYRIPDGATLRLVLNMRGGPVNTRRVPLEDSSLREMAEYFSDPVGDDHMTGDRPVTVIVYQQGEHINFFRLVDRDASSSLSYSLSGGSDFNGEEESPIPRERQEENERTRNKMKMIKEQMENLSLMKEKRQLNRCNRIPRPPSSGRPQSRSKIRLMAGGANGKQARLLNRNACLPPVGQSVPPLPTAAQGAVGVEGHSGLWDEKSGSKVKAGNISPASALPPSMNKLCMASVSPREDVLPGLLVKPQVDSKFASTSTGVSKLTEDSSKSTQTGRRSTSPAASNSASQSTNVENSVPFSGQPALSQPDVSNRLIGDDIDRTEHLDTRNEKETSQTHIRRNASIGSNQSSLDIAKTIPDTCKTQNVDDSMSPGGTVSTASNASNSDSLKTGHTAPSQTFPYPPPQPSRYFPVAPPTGGRLLPQRQPQESSRVGYGESNSAEAVLGYLMSPKRRSGGEKRPSAVTLQSLNHKEARAVSGMLRNIVRSANRSQAGYVVTGGKLAQVPTSPVPPAQVPLSDPANILRVLSGNREGRATPVRVRLPSVKLTKKKSIKRCALCKKRTKLSTGFQCRCGENFCLTHLCAEAHGCTYDYKAEGRKLIEHSNPVVTAPKLPKI